MDIDKILLKVLNNNADSAEYAALENWKQESAANLELLKELQENAQKGMDGYKDYDKNSAWHKVETRIIAGEASKPSSSRLLPIILAAVCLGLLISGFYLYESRKKEIPIQHIAQQENLQFALEDQSDIWLRNGGSELEVLSDFGEERRVSLTGEAFFEITQDINKPFIIELQNSDFVKVVGTSFNLVSDKTTFDLTIYSGVVELHTMDSVITLTKGERATRVNGAIVKLNNADLNKLSWKSNELTFHNADMITVFRAIEAHYKTEIDYTDASNNLSNCLVRTRYTNESLEQVIQELSTMHGFDFVNSHEKIIVKNLSCQ